MTTARREIDARTLEGGGEARIELTPDGFHVHAEGYGCSLELDTADPLEALEAFEHPFAHPSAVTLGG